MITRKLKLRREGLTFEELSTYVFPAGVDHMWLAQSPDQLNTLGKILASILPILATKPYRVSVITCPNPTPNVT